MGYESSFTVYDTDDSVRIIKEALKELSIQEKVMAPKGILASISAAKDKMMTPQDLLREAGGDYRQEVVAKVYDYYQKRLKAANALDFDDIIIFTVRIFQQFPDVLEKYRNRFRYIMVDEYQDTNTAQFMLVSLLASKYKNLCWSACWQAVTTTSVWSAMMTRVSINSEEPPSKTSSTLKTSTEIPWSSGWSRTTAAPRPS